ncbi:MAG: ribonuclease H family protein [Candidatus Liptonbacteria bacterium]|nr:ribonuclease H family protein [Candidatus Liptonbacteria bacterium]
MKQKYYAYLIPSKERQGITDNWPDCDRKVKGVYGARYRSFDSRAAAGEWLHSGAVYEIKPKRTKTVLHPGVYFDAGTGRGDGVEISVTDMRGRNLLREVLPKNKINEFGKHLIAEKGATNNYGELLALKYAIKYALKNEEMNIFGDSKLVIDYWSKGRIKRKDVAPKTIKLASEVEASREEFEEMGGAIHHIPGGDNPADLGFHR